MVILFENIFPKYLRLTIFYVLYLIIKICLDLKVVQNLFVIFMELDCIFGHSFLRLIFSRLLTNRHKSKKAHNFPTFSC
jgi:hypothetical protein